MSRGLTFTLDQLPPAMRVQAEARIRAIVLPPPAQKRVVLKPTPAGNKYHAVTVDGPEGRFDSKREFKRWQELKMRQAAGEISGLRRQVRFSLFDTGGACRGEHIGTYRADFVYRKRGKLVVADAKGHRSREWIRTKKLMRACHDIDVLEL